jgi:hypothetical protein
MIDRKTLELAVEKKAEDLLQRWDKQDVVRTLYHISEKLWFNFDLDYVDSWADDYVQATVYITNMMWNGAGYNVILDVDFKVWYETTKEITDEIMRLEKSAVNMIEYFSNINK